jgi:hypothetical protein
MACNLKQNFIYPENNNNLFCDSKIVNTKSSKYNKNFYKRHHSNCCGQSVEKLENVSSNCNENNCYGRSTGLMSIQNNQLPIVESFQDFENSKQNMSIRMTAYDFPIENQSVYYRNNVLGSIASHYNNDFFGKKQKKCNCNKEHFDSLDFDGVDLPIRKHSIINNNDNCGWGNDKTKSCGWTQHKNSCYKVKHTFDDTDTSCDNVQSANIEKFGNSCYSRSQGLHGAEQQFNIMVNEYGTKYPKYFYLNNCLKKKR